MKRDDALLEAPVASAPAAGAVRRTPAYLGAGDGALFAWYHEADGVAASDRVAVICPGSTNTDLSPHEGKDPKKMLQPDDVAHAVEMLVTQTPQSFMSEILLRPTQKP